MYSGEISNSRGFVSRLSEITSGVCRKSMAKSIFRSMSMSMSLIAAVFFLLSCGGGGGDAAEEMKAPTVSNFTIDKDGAFSFYFSGNPTVTAYGVCYSTTNASPTTGDTTFPLAGYTSGTASGTIADLAAATTYYCRAFATNAVGTTYSSNMVKITTPNPKPGKGDNIPPSAAKKGM